MRKTFIFLTVFIVAVVFVSGCSAPVKNGIARQVLETLAQPEWERRTVGTDGNVKAGEYLADLLKGFGYLLYKDDSMFIPYEQTITDDENGERVFTAYNIIGHIKGADSTKAWVISAHFDGKTKEGNEQATAAYDNASGCAALADVAARLAERAKNEPFERDILICFFNGEEYSLSGSHAFATAINYDYAEITTINIDCIGGKGCGALAFELADERNSLLHNALKAYMDKHSIEYNVDAFVASSDHYSFGAYNMTAAVLIQEKFDILCHTADDVIANVDVAEIEKISALVAQFVTETDGRSFVKPFDSADQNDWDAIQAEADRLTEGITLGIDDIFVFEFMGELFCKSGCRNLRTEAEIAEYFPGLSFAALKALAPLEGFELDNLRPPYKYAAPYGQYSGDADMRGLTKNETHNLFIPDITFAKDTEAFWFNISRNPTSDGYVKVPLDGEYVGYYKSVYEESGSIDGFVYADSDRQHYISLIYMTRTPMDGVDGYLVGNIIKDDKQLFELIDAFDFKNNADAIFRDLLMG